MKTNALSLRKIIITQQLKEREEHVGKKLKF